MNNMLSNEELENRKKTIDIRLEKEKNMRHYVKPNIEILRNKILNIYNEEKELKNKKKIKLIDNTKIKFIRSR